MECAHSLCSCHAYYAFKCWYVWCANCEGHQVYTFCIHYALVALPLQMALFIK